jgi:hypothetical protein
MCCCSAKSVNVITPPAEVTNVAASAAGAASDGLRPDPIRTGVTGSKSPHADILRHGAQADQERHAK